MNNWLLFTVIGGVSSSGFNIFLRKTLRANADSTAYAWWYEVIRALFFASFIPFFPQFRYSPLNVLLLLALGLTEFVAVYLYMKMHSLAELSLSAIVMQLRSVWVPIIAFFLIGEKLTLAQWGGVALVVGGAIVVARPKSLKWDRGLTTAFLMTLVGSLSGVILKETSGFASIPINMFFFSLPPIILLPLFMKNPLARIRNRWGTIVKLNFPASACNIVSMFALTAALRLGSAGQITAIFQGVSMLSVAVGVFFLNEREHKGDKLIAAVLTIIGIALLV